MREITEKDILPMEEYAKIRQQKRHSIVPHKRRRRVAVGPYATLHFEDFETMWLQVHEMLYIEKGGPDQIADELRAYNPLIPKGQELIATLMFEIPDAKQRAEILGRLGGVEETLYLDVNGDKIFSQPEGDVERTTAGGKTSSVHFLHFLFSPDAIRNFARNDVPVRVGFTHPDYEHMARLPEEVRKALVQDFDPSYL